ncbi:MULTISPECIES: nuclear transport factor 2 family protein [unclassified Gordonia (in: high G+C Gram-positive bacteria)]|uniref:nuclear transport factor 2 family protein n=1 Tax=unclassified Gordonia (in: high G+C Gram-positive bacteria) TaxID=2657482 RepID=UPI001F103337|nr:nuclear transport factor 2 family protein [Gordonia sp. ABSL49_1]MCH5643021.1 nuclear transport factor 2 family protein [Gordonia sp. ABSL49_1]
MTDKLPAVVQASIDATNAGDLKAFLATFDADGAVDDWGRVFVGNSAITRWSDNEYVGKNVTLDVTSVTTNGAETIVIAQVGGDGFNGLSTFTYSVVGSMVARMTIRE